MDETRDIKFCRMAPNIPLGPHTYHPIVLTEQGERRAENYIALACSACLQVVVIDPWREHDWHVLVRSPFTPPPVENGKE